MELIKGLKQTEVGCIPDDWECNKLEVYFSFISYGFTNPMPSVAHGVFMVTAADIYDGILQLNTARKTTEVAYRTLLSPKSKPKKNDILLTKDGSLGRLALVGSEKICINQSVAVIRPNEKVEPNFLKLLLESPTYQRKMLEDAGGSTIKHIYITIVNLMPVAIPSARKEQIAIAVVLNDVDALLAALDAALAKKRDLKQAAMQQLLTGEIRLPGFQGEWQTKRLGDSLISSPDYGINAPAVAYSDQLPAYIRITDISEGGVFLSRNLVSVDSPQATDYCLNEGDIVFARTGASVGKSYLYHLKDGPLVFAGFLIRVRPDQNKLLPSFLAAFLTTRAYWNWVKLMSMRSGQPGINGNEYAQLPLPLPSLPEQTAIAQVLSDMDADLIALTQRRDKTRALKQAMMQELLTGRIRLV